MPTHPDTTGCTCDPVLTSDGQDPDCPHHGRCAAYGHPTETDPVLGPVCYCGAVGGPVPARVPAPTLNRDELAHLTRFDRTPAAPESFHHLTTCQAGPDAPGLCE